MIRFIPFAALGVAWLVALVLVSKHVVLGTWILALLTILVALGIWDVVQRRHSLARNYPLTWYARGAFESVRPQIRQYLIESDTDGAPFDRKQRALAYARSKNEVDTLPFGTERDVRAVGYEWIDHSMAARTLDVSTFRTRVGNDACSQPYDASVLNISALSFGALGASAITALNAGALQGQFAQDTGEGGLSTYHLQSGGDLIWEIGTGYFGCRTADGNFDPASFADKASAPQVKMIEVKLSQGAKPGHGGLLPGPKVTSEIAAARDIPIGIDCHSPAAHRRFSTPIGLLEFIAELRDLSGGKPTGFKLCVGHRWEFLAVCKAMLKTGIYPDFIVVDGKEGGTGAAPFEFSDHVGTPRREGLLFVVNALTGIGARERIKVAASGKLITGFDMAVTMAIGADWCNSARGFMFALGCLQSQHCHTNKCPVGVATQDPLRQRALVVEDKAVRVANFHQHTVAALASLIAAAGLTHPDELLPEHIRRRVSPTEVLTLRECYEWLAPGELRADGAQGVWAEYWAQASAESFKAAC